MILEQVKLRSLRDCYIWAQSVLHQGENQAQSLLHPEESQAQSVLHPEESHIQSFLHKYTIVIPIILRFVKEENTLMDMITSLFECLNVCQACAVIKLLENKPSEVLLLLDGYDEYTGHSKIMTKITNKEECADILTFTTSRPHAIEHTHDTYQSGCRSTCQTLWIQRRTGKTIYQAVL